MKTGNRRWMAAVLAAAMLLAVTPVCAAEPEPPAEAAETAAPLPVETGDLPEETPAQEEPEPEEPEPEEGPTEDEPVTLLAEGADVEGVYTTWESAVQIADGQTATVPLNTYNSEETDPQIWFAVTLEDGQAVQMDLTGVAKNIYLYIYDRATLETSGPSHNNYEVRLGQFNGDRTYSWKADHAGVYYLMLRPYGNSYTSETLARLTCTLLDPDLNENNDTWRDATELTQNVNAYYNLNGQNDVDWFKVTTAVPGEAIKLYFTNFDYTVSHVDASVYSGADLEAGITNDVLAERENFGTDGTLSCKAAEPGDYYVKLEPYSSTGFVSKDLKLRYELVPGDEYENNDTWQEATPLPDDVNMAFNLNAANDADWFYFETTREEELVYFYFDGFDTDYSNKITYYIYDATETGYSSSLANGDISYDKTLSLTFAQVGGHYVRIRVYGSTPVENELTLRIARGATDDGEPNDTWQQATPLTQDVTRPYTLPATSDTDYFVFYVEEPNQTVELTFYNPVSGIRYNLYSGETLSATGSTSGALDSSGNSAMGSGTRTYRYMLSEPGSYYLRLTTNTAFTEDASVTYTLIPPDANERNNTWKTATTLNEGVSMAYTLPADNDNDYFKFTATEPNQTVEVTFTNPVSGIQYYLYSGADYEAEGDSAGALTSSGNSAMGSGTRTYRYMLSEPGDYYLRLYTNTAFDTGATVTYRLLDPDENERNNTWKTATALTEGVAMTYTLPATNDNDYFKFTVAEPNQTVEFTFYNPVSGIRYYLYSGADYEAEGDGAGALISSSGTGMSSGSRVMRYMLEEPGNYYLRLSTNTVFDTGATVTYELIAPDAHENNGYWNWATELPAQQAVSFTLPAGNDYDWFAIDDVSVGDKVQVTIGDIDSGTVTCYLYTINEGDTSASSAGAVRFYDSDGTSTKTFTVSEEADHYFLRVNCDSATDQVMYLRYAVVRDGVAVKGVSLEGGDVDVFAGKTLQLYAKVTPSNAANQAVTWQSSQPSVAEVDENGLVTAKAEGSTTITVTTADGSYTDSTVIQVVPPIPVTGVVLTAEGISPNAGTEADPRPLALDTGVQMTASVQPETATERGVTWSVSDGDVLAVTSSGKVYAVGSGKARVTAATVDGNYTADYWFSVPDKSYPVRGISLNYNAATIYMGESGIDLLATVSPSYATNPAVNWKSDNPDVAAVDQYGHVRPISKGYATITVTAAENPGVQNSCLISVQPVRTRVEAISFPESQLSLGLYGTVTLAPVFEPADATDQTVTWESSNKAVATVSRTGAVTAIGLGTATITATSTDGDHQASVTVTVSLNAGYGDVDNNGSVDAADAVMVLQNSVGLLYLSEVQQETADVNGDGFVDAADAILILRYNVGLIDSFPVEDE